ncbi:D-alanyl-D-alanine carboxypeptidase/D-alanyl-D-alanine-endopeptidase [Acaricomes phytoseiuli]|uniref:D-alanyl-D-alanine carboxypeptidase/D-alanyl-D-alanine endopeptidase n=1 Tax=Acaricomes phytoseiuli TaxID=291968 RepID=UPI00036A36C9|nr:D-alanyl-D-alanine carboxypeptidase/D-alanyl-D-alanine-endopeptidase [Acaricomes phytoseiuli]MCW1249246.1 D-alanyl-D-alanine carboxypeptidase/D-alanyl-D-alanine-endopeptidase [Acaricomes phytoseiuli]
MRRVTRAVQIASLVLVLALLAIPFAINAAPAVFLPSQAAEGRSAEQSPPTALNQIDIASLLQDSGSAPDQGQLSQDLDAALSSVPGTFTGQVLDAETGAQIYGRDPQAAMIPASNLKLLTAITALEVIGPESTFATTARLRPATTGEPAALVLQAGGDALLGGGASDPQAVAGRAGLNTLAQQTAQALGAEAAAGYQLLVDDRLFTGPALNPAWESGDVQAGEIAPIYPIAINSAFPVPGSGLPRPEDAAMNAAQSFAASLAQYGVSVQGQPARLSGDAGAPEQGRGLASVQSASVGEQVSYMLRNSDNYLSEVLARMSAVTAGRAGSSDDAIAVTRQTLSGLGLDMTGVVLADNAGLSSRDRLSAAQMTAAVQLIAQGPDPVLRRALEGLPVAGLTGTLENRYATAATASGAGLIRAKTGTLNTVMTLSGTVVNSEGRLLLFSFMANDLPGGAGSAPPALDRAAARLAG